MLSLRKPTNPWKLRFHIDRESETTASDLRSDDSTMDDDHLSADFIGFHEAMRFADLLEAKQLGRLLANAAAFGDFAAHRSTTDPHRRGLVPLGRRCIAG